MSNKKSLVDQMINFLEQSNNSSLEDDDESSKKKNCRAVQLYNSNNNNDERNIVVMKKELNFHKKIFNVLPHLGHNHIDMLFGVSVL